MKLDSYWHGTPCDNVPSELTSVLKRSGCRLLSDQFRHRHERSHAQQLLRPKGELLPSPGIVATAYFPYSRSHVT